jgi:hypothetical protein
LLGRIHGEASIYILPLLNLGCTIHADVVHKMLTMSISLAIYFSTVGLTGCTTIKTKDDLSDQEIGALEESQSRINVYRERMQGLNKSHEEKSIDGHEYTASRRTLRILIEKESNFQGAIIQKDSALSVKAQHLADDIWEVGRRTPNFMAHLAVAFLLAVAKSGKTISVR